MFESFGNVVRYDIDMREIGIGGYGKVRVVWSLHSHRIHWNGWEWYIYLPLFNFIYLHSYSVDFHGKCR